MAYGIVRQHGGLITVQSQPGCGSRFDIFLPRHQPHAEVTEAKAPPVPGGRGGRETVMVVEDTEAVRELACRILERHGYRVLQAENGEAALLLAGDGDIVVDLLLTDVVMPGMNGRELYLLLAAQRPGVRVLFMSGYTDDVIAHHGVLEQGVAFIQKPFTVDDFSRKVREALDGPPSGPS
jgi:two-component system, cell cycle sensor histidine kinase and response regulator CckA